MRILYIDIDSCRPDHLGCYGYHRDTSPQIDQVAKEGIVFERCYTSDAPCMPSRTALYSGRFGIQTGVVGHGGTAGNPKVDGARRGFVDSFVAHGLARRLSDLGLHTAMISPFGQRHAAHWFYAGFREIHDTGKGGMESAEEVSPKVEQWLETNAANDDWFLHVNFWDPHTPYRVPSSYGDPFAGDPLPEWLCEETLARHRATVGPHTAQEINMYDPHIPEAFPRQPGCLKDMDALRQMIDGYDTAIRYTDDAVGRIVEILKAAGVYEDTAIIISADHGENQGELGIYGEHGTADSATCRIPLIIKWPGMESNRVAGFCYNVDLAPTMVDLLQGYASPLWNGQSLVPALKGEEASLREELVISQCAHVCQRSVLWKDWLYVRTYHDGFRLFPQEMLFNLATDPHETEDLATVHTEVCQEGAWRLSRWHDAQMQQMAKECSDVVDPLWTVIHEGGPFHARLTSPGNPGSPAGLAAYLDYLESTGRSDGAARLRAKYLQD
jgi:choline-sulfatase